jgi:hypothetical protein
MTPPWHGFEAGHNIQQLRLSGAVEVAEAVKQQLLPFGLVTRRTVRRSPVRRECRPVSPATSLILLRPVVNSVS